MTNWALVCVVLGVSVVGCSADEVSTEASPQDSATTDTALADSSAADTVDIDTATSDTGSADTDSADTSDGATEVDGASDAPTDVAVDASCTTTADGGAEAGVGTTCSGACVDTKSDPAHCGSCEKACTVGQACVSATCVDVAGVLSGLRWELPCLSSYSASVCTTNATSTHEATLAGAAGTSYDLTLRFRGVVETKAYTGGSNDGAYFQTAGTPAADDWNIYRLDVSDPPQTFYLNRGDSGLQHCWGVDYTAVVRVKAGAKVSIYASAVDGGPYEIKNLDAAATPAPIVVPGVTPAPSAFDGQFLQMDVVSAKPSP